MRAAEIRAGSEIVKIIKKTKSPKVTDKDLRSKYGDNKKTIFDKTKEFPEAYERFKSDQQIKPAPIMSNDELAISINSHLPDYRFLLRNVLMCTPGREDAHKYHAAVMSLINAIFHGSLSMPKKEATNNRGSQRIDIRYACTAIDGFFFWLKSAYTCPYIYVECKNYNEDIGNPEVDQMLGRFHPSKGKVGLIFCRTIEDRNRVINKTANYANSDRGYIVCITDEDLKILVNDYIESGYKQVHPRMHYLFDELTHY